MPYPALDPWQYRLAADLSGGREAGHGFRLETGPDLPVTTVEDAAGAAIGLLIGFPIDLAAKRLVGDRWQAPLDPARGPALSVLWALGGRFLYVHRGAAGLEVYPDAEAQVPCVHDPVARRIGSSAHALMDDAEYEARFDRALFDALGVLGEGWFPGTLTAHRGLRRLYPGHVLETAGWQVRRHWPTGGPTPDAPVSTDALVDEFVGLVQAQLAALVEGPRKVAVALTAGLDSRSMLAMARPFRERIECVTVVAGDRHKTDSVIARRIASDQGIPHVELPRITATPGQQDLFLRRGGHCNGDTNRLFHPSTWPLAEGHVFVGSLGAEVGRAFFWRAGDGPQTRLSPEQMVQRMGLPAHPALIEALRARMADEPAIDGLRLLDLLYVEERMASWSSVQFPSDPGLVRHAPMITMRGLELMLALPPEWKRESRLGREIVRRAWPELAAYPVNSLGRVQDAWLKLRRAAANPAVIAKKLRKLRA